MRKIVIIVIIACLVVAVIMSSIFIGGSKSEVGASASVSQVEGSMVVWNKERDQKLFETKDASAIGSVVTFIKTAKWTSVKAEPSGSSVKNTYNLTVYDTQGKGEEYSLLYMNDNTIVLFYQKANTDGTYLQASFPVQAGGLNDYFKINPDASVTPSAAASASGAVASASASAS
jgi:hypothetical protein